MTNKEWAERYRARIVSVLTAAAGWTPEGAESAALEAYAATACHDAMSGYEEDPAGAADMELSYWDSDGE